MKSALAKNEEWILMSFNAPMLHCLFSHIDTSIFLEFGGSYFIWGYFAAVVNVGRQTDWQFLNGMVGRSEGVDTLREKTKNKMEAESNQSTIDLAFKDCWRLLANPFSPCRTFNREMLACWRAVRALWGWDLLCCLNSCKHDAACEGWAKSCSGWVIKARCWQ